METNPYAPPRALVIERAPDTEKYHDLGGLTKAVSLLLLVGLFSTILNIASSLMQYSLLSGEFTHEQAVANDERELLISGCWLLLYIATMCVFGRWIYVAHRNLPALGAQKLRFSPGWAVGSFFIPLYCLWGPCQAMNDLVRASRDPRQWHLDDAPMIIVVWWALWIIASLGGNVTFRLNMQAADIESLRSLSLTTVILEVLAIPLYLFARQIVLGVARDQAVAAGNSS